MEQKITSRGGRVASAILVFTGITMIAFAIAVLFSYPEEIWALGLILLTCSGAVLYGAIKSFRSSSQKLSDADDQIRQIQNNAITKRPVVLTDLVNNLSVNSYSHIKPHAVLVHWSYTKDEWKRFYNRQRVKRKWVTFIISLMIAAVSTFLLKGSLDASWPGSIAISLGVGFIYGIISYRFAMASIGKPDGQLNSIIITGSSVLINDKLNPFADENRRMGEIKILEDANPKVLEITYHWKTGKGANNDEIHIPIPKGKLGEAVMLMERLKNVSRET